MYRSIFGSDNAWQDAEDGLLFECAVRAQIRSKPILKGRWGTGKTAYLLLANRELTKELARANDAESHLWYISEQDLDVRNVTQLRDNAGLDRQNLIRSLEKVWMAEILRRLCLILSRLHGRYGSPSGDHWAFIDKVARAGGAIASIWNQIPKLLTVITGKSDREGAVQGLQDSVNMLFTQAALSHVQQCLADIRGKPPLPVIAVEPVETPGGPLEEDPRLAQAVVTALLNLYVSHFLPSARQPVDLRACIPWHRYVLDEVDFPQRLFEYVEAIKWKKTELREFIDLRIDWELRKVGRGSSNDPPFRRLFEQRLKNDHCEPEIYEDAFEYVLRHTHHRPRDLQRLARECVLGFARMKGLDPDGVLAGKKGVKVSGAAIREAIREVGRAQMNEVFTEARRRLTDFDKIVAGVRGISIPFTTDDLGGRRGVADVNETIRVLWSSGILGVQITTREQELHNHLKHVFGDEPLRQFAVGKKPVYVWSFFEYNWEGEARELLDRYEEDAKLVIHPRAFEELGIHVGRDHPIGV